MRGSMVFHIMTFVAGLIIAVLLFGVFFKAPVAAGLSIIAGMDPTKIQEETATLLTVAAYIPGNVSWGVQVSAPHDVKLGCALTGTVCSPTASIWLNVTPAVTRPFNPPTVNSTISVPRGMNVYPTLITLWKLSSDKYGLPVATPGYLMARKLGNMLRLDFETVSVKV